MAIWKPYALCGARDALCYFGELVRLSGVSAVWGWIIAHSETLNVQFLGVCGGAVHGYGETLGAFGRVGTF